MRWRPAALDRVQVDIGPEVMSKFTVGGNQHLRPADGRQRKNLERRAAGESRLLMTKEIP